MPAVLLPCANCHGHDGLGRPEGGVEPPDITWGHLTKSYGHRHPNGREHGPFDRDGVAAAISGGVDTAGNALDPLMPRYEMSGEDVAALVAFLKRLEASLDPGLSEDAIRIGTLLPGEGPYAPLGQAVAATLSAYFGELNARGGVFGRRLELVVADYAEDPGEAAANALRLAEQEAVFAVLGAFVLGVEGAVFPVFEQAGLPDIGPFTLFAGHGDFPAERTFFLISGLPDQARALADYAARNLEPAPRRSAIVIPPAGLYDEVARAVQDRVRRQGGASPAVLRLTGDQAGIAQAVTELSVAGVEAVHFFADTTVLGRFAAEAAARGWVPRLLLPGETAGRAVFALPGAFDGRVHLAYPNLPEDQSAEGNDELEALGRTHGLSAGHLASRIHALAAAKVLVEGLRRSGRSLSRAALADSLESLDKLDTGQLPPLSFAADRRVGVRGAHVLTVDLASRLFRPEAVWVAVD